MTNSDHYWTTAADVCTPKELEALELRDRHQIGDRRIAMILGVTRWAVRDRLDNADRKIAAAMSDNPDDQEAA